MDGGKMKNKSWKNIFGVHIEAISEAISMTVNNISTQIMLTGRKKPIVIVGERSLHRRT